MLLANSVQNAVRRLFKDFLEPFCEKVQGFLDQIVWPDEALKMWEANETMLKSLWESIQAKNGTISLQNLQEFAKREFNLTSQQVIRVFVQVKDVPVSEQEQVLWVLGHEFKQMLLRFIILRFEGSEYEDRPLWFKIKSALNDLSGNKCVVPQGFE